MRETHVQFNRSDVKEIKRGVADSLQKELINDVGDAGLLLFQFYMSKSYLDHYTFQDEDAKEALGWTLDKVARVRRKLTKARYFYQESGSYSSGRKIFTTYLGKAKVHEALGIRELSIFEMMGISDRVLKELGFTMDELEQSKEKLKKAQELTQKYIKEAENTPTKASPS